MAALSDADLLALTERHFGDLGPGVVQTMYAIAKAESGGNPDAANLSGLDRSYGLWQVNIHPKANPDLAGMNLVDPEQNAAAARIILDRAGFTPWSTYTGGAYKKYLGLGMGDAAGGQTTGSGRDNTNPAAYDFIATGSYKQPAPAPAPRQMTTQDWQALAPLIRQGGPHNPLMDALAKYGGDTAASMPLPLIGPANSAWNVAGSQPRPAALPFIIGTQPKVAP